MTLTLTMASALGIVMAADSAVTGDGRSLSGVQKLLPIRNLNAGISVWGIGRIGNVDTDKWLQTFIIKEINSTMTLWDAAEAVAQALNRDVRQPVRSFSGVHVAGYDANVDGEKYPAIYHVHNVYGEYNVGILDGKIGVLPGATIGEFRANRDVPPEPIAEGEIKMRRNGDIFLYSVLWERMNEVLSSLVEQTDFRIPSPSTLESYGEYLRIWIAFIGQLYRNSNAYPHELDMPVNIGTASIGGPVSVLTIASNGINSFYAT